ncbi:MAG: HK97 family phage prohead protease [Proteobacteria bacterium]|nr:HK97 family phage prohead protease [Pseudomonadota bacterium]
MEQKNQTSPFLVKSIEEDGVFSGYASVFDCVDFQNDQVMPGAFAGSLENWRSKNTWPKMLWQHDYNHPIGVWLDMQEDDKGLLVKGRFLLEVTKGREAYALLKNGVTNGLSIGFSLERAIKSPRGHQLLQQINLHEVSLVTYAANPKAKVEWFKQKNVIGIEQRISLIAKKLAGIL